MRLKETPVPIPNTQVKIKSADGTSLETDWESRWLPTLKTGCGSVWLERLIWVQEAAGSSPVTPI